MIAHSRTVTIAAIALCYDVAVVLSFAQSAPARLPDRPRIRDARQQAVRESRLARPVFEQTATGYDGTGLCHIAAGA